MLRAAQKVAQDPAPQISRDGKSLYKELHRLFKTDKTTLTEGGWRALQMRLKGGSSINSGSRTMRWVLFAHVFIKSGNHCTLFSALKMWSRPTTVRNERFVLRSPDETAFGSTSEQGLHWTERILSCWQTCRMQGWSFFEFLRNAMGNYLRGIPQDLGIYDALLQRA